MTRRGTTGSVGEENGKLTGRCVKERGCREEGVGVGVDVERKGGGGKCGGREIGVRGENERERKEQRGSNQA